MTNPTDLLNSTELRFTIWPDTDTDGIITDSDDALYYLLPVLGPTATLVLHRIARHLRYAPEFTFPADELAAQFGVGTNQLRASLHRLQMFDTIRPDGDRFEVRIVKRLTLKMHTRLPISLQTDCPYEPR